MIHIQFRHFHIDSVKDSSGVFTGDNIQIRFSSMASKREGNGSTVGDLNVFMNNVHTINKHPSADTKAE